MTVELKPEQERIIQEQLASGYFKSVDEVLTAALGRLPHLEHSSNRTAVERMIEFSRTHSVKLPAGETVEALVREMRISQ
jgi:Arc/MetJ-type ribon-helix-helix transcriptional regulator